MQSLERSAMRSLVILIFLTVARGIPYNIQYASIDLDINDSNQVTIDLTKNDGTKMFNILYARSENPQTSFKRGPENNTITIKRTLSDPDDELLDCFQLNDMQWFGGPEYRYQRWPIEDMYYDEQPYLPTQSENMAIAERYWLSSKGIYIYVDADSPLFLDQNNYRDKKLCMVVKNQAPYQRRQNLQVTYTIGVFPDPKTAHQYAVKNHLHGPSDHPNELMIRYPIWSTWARYKANISEEVVDTFANEINNYEFKNSQIEIDDKWERCYGSAEFDTDKFPNAGDLIQRLKTKGFRVTLWIHPFINQDCQPAYSEALDNSYFVKNLDGDVCTTWWEGTNAAIIDFTNPDAIDWWVQRLKLLQTLGIDSFKFDAGEVSWLPQMPVLQNSPELQPGIFTQKYVRNLASAFGDSIEVRVGWQTQDLPIFVRMLDKDTRWTWNNGLPTLITTLLQMNLNGYVYVLPDMIGGNGYLDGSITETERPSKELFIRWLQATVFMPSLQYSFVPWDYDNETIKICKQYTELHANVTEDILNAMQKAIDDGTPVNPPIWWIAPNDVEAHKVNDEYLLGESILVAPIIEEGVVKRDIYLPEGSWCDAGGVLYEGPMWIKDYNARIDVLPYFRKNEDEGEKLSI